MDILRLAKQSFQVTDARIEMFVDGAALVLGVEVTTRRLRFSVEPGLAVEWAPEVVIDRLMVVTGNVGTIDGVGAHRSSWESETESLSAIRVYDVEPVFPASANLELSSSRKTLELAGRVDLHCGGDFDLDVPIELECRLTKVVFLAGRQEESDARASLRAFMDDEYFRFVSDGPACRLELELPAQSSVAPDSPSSVAPPGGGAPSSGPRVNAGIGQQDSEDDPTKKDPP